MNHPTSLADGRYLLVQQLGEGGMATVYRAYDQRLQVWRAVKILSPEFADKKKIARRFEAEAQTMALLEHRNIVRVYDVGRDGANIAYIVMELVEGGCLVDWLESNGPMPPRMACDVVMEVCDGLQAAHDKGIIHRDIKPHNVMVTLDGVCRVTDFGIARVGDSQNSQTKTGSVMGTWGYMAPEQRTDAKNVDVRADVYATGATLYSLLTDRMPMDLFAAERNSSILDGVHELLIPLLIQSTEYDREDRFADMMAFKAALAEVRDQLPTIGEEVEALALQPSSKPLVPDPSEFRPATEVGVVRTRGDVGSMDDTVLPGDVSGATLVAEGDETRILDGQEAGHRGHMTLPPEEVAVTEPGAVTRQSRPVFQPSDAAATVLRSDVGTEAPIPERTAAPVTSSGTNVAVVLGGLSLLVAILALGVVLFLVLREPSNPAPSDPVVVNPQPSPEPAPIAVPVQPDPVPTQVEPTPVPPTPEPAPKPPEPAPQPAERIPVPEPVTPDPVPVTEPVAPEPVTPPEPEPKSSRTTCVKPPSVKANSAGNKLIFKVQPCEGNPADWENRIVVHYRIPGKGYLQHDLPPRGSGWLWGLALTDEHKSGVEYYISGWDGSYGTAGSPKVVIP